MKLTCPLLHLAGPLVNNFGWRERHPNQGGQHK